MANPSSPGPASHRTVYTIAIFVGAGLALLANDHLWKYQGPFPAAVTGKVSDALGLLLAPVALVWMVGARARAARLICFASVALFFVSINVVPTAARIVEWVFHELGHPWRLWPDPWDLLALPTLWPAWRLARPTIGHDGRRPSRSRLLGALGMLACMASGTLYHHEQAYLVNRTGAPLLVEATWLRSAECRLPSSFPDNILRSDDFLPYQDDARDYVLEPDGVLPLYEGCNARRIRLAGLDRLLLWDPELPVRRLENQVSGEDLRDETGFILVEGTAAAPTLRPGARTAVKEIAPQWAPVFQSRCSHTDIPLVEAGQWPAVNGATILGLDPLGGQCFALRLDLPGDARDAGAPADAGIAVATDAGVDDASPPFDGKDALAADASARPSLPNIITLCVPQALFPFAVGDRIDLGQDRIRHSGGTTEIAFVEQVFTPWIDDFAPPPPPPGAPPTWEVVSPDPCGFVRDDDGTVWRPFRVRHQLVDIVPGQPIALAGRTVYLSRAQQVFFGPPARSTNFKVLINAVEITP